MITWHDLYTVLAALVPLYVAMILAYGSVRWWKIFSPDQCSGINRFVAVFAVPLLSFHFISTNNPYEMNFRFIAADTLQKIIILLVLGMWTTLARNGSLEWMITIFSLSTQPNTLVMGIPLLIAMYGPYSGSLMVQIVVLQCIIWYTLLLFLFEYRGAKILIVEQFPGTAASIVSFKVDSDVVSLDGRGFLETEAQVGGDGKLHVTVRKSNASRRSIGSIAAGMTPRPSNLTGAEIYSMSSSRNPTPRGSNFNNADFYSMMGYQSGFVQGRRSSFGAMDMYSVQSSLGPTPRPSNFEETGSSVPMAPQQATKSPSFGVYAAAANAYPAPNPEFVRGGTDSNNDSKERRDYENNDNNNNNNNNGNGEGKESQHPSSESNKNKIKVINNNNSHDAKELHMFVWSSSASPASEVDGLHVFGSGEFDTPAAPSGRSDHGAKEIRMWVSDHPNQNGEPKVLIPGSTEDYGREEYFSFVGGRGVTSGGALDEEGEMGGPNGLSKLRSSSTAELRPKADSGVAAGSETGAGKQMPPASVMTRLILIMVWRKLIRNPNTYSSLIGLIWSLVAFRWHVKMPTIIDKSISILSDAGLGMAMFSLGWMEEVGRPTCGAGPTNILAWCCGPLPFLPLLQQFLGLFMALQPKIVACGNSVATFAMIIRFVTGPAIMAAASIVIGLRGDLLRIAIIQAALPQGIVPFVFAKEYNNHPAILSTAVIFGMLIALPIDLLYYVLLGL